MHHDVNVFPTSGKLISHLWETWEDHSVIDFLTGEKRMKTMV